MWKPSNQIAQATSASLNGEEKSSNDTRKVQRRKTEHHIAEHNRTQQKNNTVRSSLPVLPLFVPSKNAFNTQSRIIDHVVFIILLRIPHMRPLHLCCIRDFPEIREDRLLWSLWCLSHPFMDSQRSWSTPFGETSL